MGSYDVQQVCINGHQVTDGFNRYPEFRRPFCEKCGAKTIHACPKCGTEIKGFYDVPGVLSIRETPIPSHCSQCGVPFPWAEQSKRETNSASPSGMWMLTHPRIKDAAESRFLSGHHADAVEAAFKEIDLRVKRAWVASGQSELDGSALMFRAFATQNPLIKVGDHQSQSGKSMQEGYMHLFAGAIMGIRNPKAHDNLTITERRGLQFLVFASLLMEKLDKAGIP